jgi:hypothetical protein
VREEHHGSEVGDHGHGCKENGVGRADHGLQGFFHRSFDRRTELRQSEAGFLGELQPARLKFEPGSVAETLRAFLPEVMLRGLINPGAIPPILSQCYELLIDKPQRKQEML